MYQRHQQIHFVGIGGIGMSGIAELLINLGHRVSGSDLKESETTRRLVSLGVRVAYGHAAGNLGQADVVVISSAVKEDNPEVAVARERLVPVIPRAEMLAELMRLKYGLAVAGAHGKTTTTSMVAALLAAGNLDPTVVVGGKVGALGSNSRLGQGDFLVAEADESDGSFNRLSPVVVVVTNIDREHMDHYVTDEALDVAFVEFMNKVPFYGAAIVCLDDARVASLIPRLRKRTITYGLTSQADFQARDLVADGLGQSYNFYLRGELKGTVRLPFPGRHYVLNSLGALAAAHEVGVDLATAMAACATLGGVKRRFERKVRTANGALVMDDYAHHPTEIKATLEAARSAWPEGRLVVCFQPHRYSRTKDLFDQFARCFYGADALLVLDIYAASEKPDPTVTAEALAEAIRAHGHRRVEYVGTQAAAKARLAQMLGPGDVLFTMGAGDVWRLGEEMAADKDARGAGLDAELMSALTNILGPRALFGEPLAAHTTWGLGGPALCLAKVRSMAEAAAVLAACQRTGCPVKALGRGSNLLAGDRGFPGVMLKLAGPLAGLKASGQVILAGGGASLGAAVKLATRLGLSGLEWAAGIPGTVGGAVATNAGAHGADMARVAARITLLSAKGEVLTVERAELPAAYRRRELPMASLVLGAELALTFSSPETVAARVAELLAARRRNQPLGAKIAGSVFKNPPSDYAGRLIEAAGLKGRAVGRAVVSTKHANFIVNRGGATAAEVLALMDQMRNAVRERFGVELAPEVEVVGDV